MMTLLESDDEAKAPTRQITGQSSSELDESVTNAIEIRPFIASVRDIKDFRR